MLFSSKQIQQLKDVMDKYTTTFIFHTVGASVLSDEDKLLLRSIGFSVQDINEATTNVAQAFKFGLLSDAIGNDVAKRMNFKQFKEHLSSGRFIPLNQREQDALDALKYQMAAGIKQQSDSFKRDLDESLVEIERGRRAIHSKRVLDAAAQAIQDRQSVAQLRGELGRRTGQWSRNLGRMADYVFHEAFNTGRVASIKRKNSQVYFDVFPGSCTKCIQLYLTAGVGSAPKVFDIETLMNNGSNVGLKKEDWKATIGPIHPHCYDDQTEVLTNQGWKLFKDLNKTEQFLSVNLNTQQGEWKKAVKYLDLPYSGPMHSFQNKNFNLITTPNHHHVINTRASKRLRLVDTKSLPTEANFLKHIPNWIGVTPQFEFDGIEFDVKLMFEFLGFFISEGCIIQHSGRYRIHVSQSLEKYYEEIYRCMSTLFGKAYKCQGYIQVNLQKNQVELIEFLSLGKSYEKYIPQAIKEGTIELLNIFLQSYCMGDGSFVKGRKWDGYQCKDSRVFYTSSKKLSDDLGEIILKIGKTPSYVYREPKPIFDPKRGKSYTSKYGMWIINETTNKFCGLPTMNHTIEQYDGNIYDIELESNHTLLIRRGGKVCVSGNCRCTANEVPEGYVWDEQTQSFTQPKQERKVQRTSKVTVTVNNKKTVI